QLGLCVRVSHVFHHLPIGHAAMAGRAAMARRTGMATTPTPQRLGRKARRLWRDVTSVYDLRPDELRVLEDACREVDLIERLEEELRDAQLVVRGSMGQPVANPLVQEIRQHRAVLRGLLGSLKLPDEDDRQALARSTSARAAAQARWRRGA